MAMQGMQGMEETAMDHGVGTVDDNLADQRQSRFANKFDEDGKKEKEKPMWKICMKYMFSHVGLIILVFLYCVAGAFLFQAIESPAEDEKRQMMDLEMKRLEQEIEIGLRGHWLNLKQDTFDEARFRENASAHLRHLLPQFVEASKTFEKFGQKGATYQRDWETMSSFLFAVSIITTIGYGHIAPETEAGQLVCIVYSLIGIPLMLMCLANIGDVMANSIRYFYGNILCAACNKKKPRQNQVTDINSVTGSIQQIIPDDDEDEEEKKKKKNEKVNVPITLTFLLFVAYVMLGAAIFSLWEDWALSDGAYFSFVTVSTIGFGDLVPGAALEDNALAKMLVLSLYMLCGLAMLSMAVALVQEELSAKFRWVGTKLGIVKPQDDDEESDFTESESEEEGLPHGYTDDEQKGETDDAKKVAGGAGEKRKRKRKRRTAGDEEEDSDEDDFLDQFEKLADETDVANRKKKIMAA